MNQFSNNFSIYNQPSAAAKDSDKIELGITNPVNFLQFPSSYYSITSAVMMNLVV